MPRACTRGRATSKTFTELGYHEQLDANAFLSTELAWINLTFLRLFKESAGHSGACAERRVPLCSLTPRMCMQADAKLRRRLNEVNALLARDATTQAAAMAGLQANLVRSKVGLSRGCSMVSIGNWVSPEGVRCSFDLDCDHCRATSQKLIVSLSARGVYWDILLLGQTGADVV